jgi:hypothetical protein
MSWHPRERPAVADLFLESYISWREACEDVQSAYDKWRRCDPVERPLQFASYRAALEREERAALIHSEWAGRLSAVAA